MGRFLKLILTIAFVGVSILTGIFFGMQNDDPIVVHFFNTEYTVRLFALCYLFMIGGLFITLLIVSYDYIKIYAQNRSLKRELRYYIRLNQEKQLVENSESTSSITSSTTPNRIP